MDAVKCRAFLAAADFGSMSAAAEMLGYTQSGITRMIHALEEEAGFPLLVRGKGGVELSGNGRLMVPAFREIVRADENARQISAGIGNVITGVLTIGSYYSISALMMPGILSRFEKQYPQIRIRVQEGGNREMAKWLYDKAVDCCFCARPEDKVPCDWIPIFEDELVVWLPEQSPRAERASFPLKELESEPFIQVSPGSDTDLDRLLKKYHLKPNIRYTTRDAFSAYNMVSAGLGISFNQKLISREWRGKVAEIPFDEPEYISLGIAVPALQDISPATDRFISSVKEEILGEKKGT